MPRFFCLRCRKTATWKRPDVRNFHHKQRMANWLTGVESLSSVAKDFHITRQGLWKKFRPFFKKNPNGITPLGFKAKMLIVDAKFIHGRILCALIAVTEENKIFWQFADSECYGTWYSCLIRFSPPEVVVADGQKGVARFVKRYWPNTAFQRCHFHLVQNVIHYISRNPREEAGVDMLHLAYRLKYVKNYEDRDRWKLLHRIWEKQHEKIFNERTEAGGFRYRKLRSARFIMRRAIPDLFTYLDYPGCPNTTNLVEGWVNTAIAERLSRHRGLRLSQKKTLVSTILSNLSRN